MNCPTCGANLNLKHCIVCQKTWTHDELMKTKGYKYKLDPIGVVLFPLYSKTLNGIPDLLRSYSELKFNITKL